MRKVESQAGAMADDDRPWERPGVVRRDCEPHRSDQLSVVAVTSLVLGLLSCGLAAPAALGVPLALFAATLARRDLKKMGEGSMDPSGDRLAREAEACAVLGAFLNTAGAVLALSLWANVFR
jgi:hypothetical protein